MHAIWCHVFANIKEQNNILSWLLMLHLLKQEHFRLKWTAKEFRDSTKMHRLHSFPTHPHFYVFCETDTFDMTYLFNSSLQVPRMCVSKMGQHGLGNGLAPVGRQVIPSTDADLLLIGPSYQIKKQERRLKRRNTLGGLEISTRHQIVNTLELSSPPPPPPPPEMLW